MASEKQVVVKNTLGIHVRPAAALAQTAKKFTCDVQVIKDGIAVNAKSPIDLLTLASVKGTTLIIKAEGQNSEQAVREVAALIESGFGEE